MVKGFPRMDFMQKLHAPTGYIFLTNVGYPSIISLAVLNDNGDCIHANLLREYRDKYGDARVVTPAFDVFGRELEKTVAIYVPHPAVRRINKTLRRLGKL